MRLALPLSTALLLAMWCNSALAATFTVDTTADVADRNPGDGVCSIDDGAGGCLPACTFRAAIDEAGADPGTDTVEFAIPAGSVIDLVANLQMATPESSVVIDGSTSGGAIVIDANGYSGLIVRGPSEVRSLDILNAGGSGLALRGDGLVVSDCVFAGNGNTGISVEGATNVSIGVPGEPPNAIFDNGVGNPGFVAPGIHVGLDSNGVLIRNSLIGTDDGFLALPNTSDGITIDGATNVQIGGPGPGESNIISGNGGWGIHVLEGDAIVIEGNNIGVDLTAAAAITGTDPDGEMIVGNGFGGIFVGLGGSHVAIGGDTNLGEECEGSCNLIAGNPIGISTIGGLESITSNFIGTDSTGTVAVGNGIGIAASCPSAAVFSDNTISGNTDIGARVSGHCLLLDNAIGLSSSREDEVPNANVGVLVLPGAPETRILHNWIGGNPIGIDARRWAEITRNSIGLVYPRPGDPLPAVGSEIGIRLRSGSGGSIVAENTIGGHSTGGILATKDDPDLPILQLEIRGNSIGATADAPTIDLGNEGYGIRLEDVESSDIGTGAAQDRNTIVHSGGCGIELAGGADNRVRENTIGDWGSGNECGVLIDAHNGAPAMGMAIADSTIVDNRGHGVSVLSGAGHSISSYNQIYANGDHGIRLGSIGADETNDPGDADDGPNELQNFPELRGRSVTAANNCVLYGTLDSTPLTTFRIEVFINETCSLISEGQEMSAWTMVDTDESGIAEFALDVFCLDSQNALTATARGPGGSTSRFSNCVDYDVDDVPPLPDRDMDGIPDEDDNCPDDRNLDQADADEDGVGDVCDACPAQAGAFEPEECADPNGGGDGTDEGDESGGDEPAEDSEGTDDTGCACATRPSSGGTGAWMLALFGLTWRRRARRRTPR